MTCTCDSCAEQSGNSAQMFSEYIILQTMYIYLYLFYSMLPVISGKLKIEVHCRKIDVLVSFVSKFCIQMCRR